MSDENPQTADDRAAALKRKRLYAKITAFVIIIAIAILKPKVEAWLAGQQAPATKQSDGAFSEAPIGSADTDESVLPDSDSFETTDPAQKEGVDTTPTVSPVDQFTVKTGTTLFPDSSTSTQTATSTRGNSETDLLAPKVAKSTQGKEPDLKPSTSPKVSQQPAKKAVNSGKPRKTSPLPRMAQPPPLGTSDKAAGDASRSNPGRDNSSSGTKNSTGKKTAADSAGPLVLVKGTRDEFRSTAGLMYVRGSEDGHRVRHVMKHAKDNPNKPVHGVFDGTRDEIFTWIDRAYVKGKKGGKGTRVERQGGRTVFTVDLGEKIGFVGGQVGKRKGHPPCRYLRLVIQNGVEVVTAYPAQSL